MLAAKAGVPINPARAITVKSFFMTAPKHTNPTMRPAGGLLPFWHGEREILERSDVRSGSKADVTLLNFDVRFTPESGHSPTRSRCLLWATRRHSHRTKNSSLLDDLRRRAPNRP